MTPAVLIFGPTASGKTALAVRLARAIGGEVVNADSQQLYRDLRVLTARPTPEEEALAPHHLFGVADAAEAWSAGRWQRAAMEAISDILARGRTPIVAGGTGLYFKALTEGLSDIPPVPEPARTQARRLWDEAGEARFRERLRALDPEAEARIAAGDRQRLTRALEVVQATGRPLSAWQGERGRALPPGEWTGVALSPPREALYARCEARFDRMLEQGALEEARALFVRGLDPQLPAMKATGLRELIRHIEGEISLEEAAALAKRETRRYAKRQMTWLRQQTPDWPRLQGLDLSTQWEGLAALPVLRALLSSRAGV
ncbi:MAG TPA: tRNA (adenosine(37)-N6)-dimethylallyltransferase MiaA [Caulobacteraceae bacterium]|jgi:tRNA dimethylallyltransferase